MKTPLGFKIGADPEFEFRRNGHTVRASDVFGFDLTSHLGTDGASSTAELRVNAGSYYEITQEISRLIGQAQKVSGCEAYAGSGITMPLGGHIHFSGIPTDAFFIGQLEKFITAPLNTVSDRSARHHYGHQRGEIRRQPHGWEFRSPLSWLSTPILTNGVLAIAWVLARAYKNGECHRILNKATLLDYCYKRERVAIDLFFESIKIYKRDGTKLESIEMFKAWGKATKRTPTHEPTYSSDDFMEAIATATSTHTLRYNPYACYIPLRFFGVALHRNSKLAIFVSEDFTWLRDVKHLGADVVLMPQDMVRGRAYDIGLSHNLRRHTQKSTWVIKRIIKAINDREEG